MVQMNPKIKEQLKNLRKISYGSIKERSAGVVEVKIKDLSPKDLARCLAVSTSAFTEISQRQHIIKKITEELIKGLDDVFNDDKLNDSEKILKLKELLTDSDLEGEHLSSELFDEGKES